MVATKTSINRELRVFIAARINVLWKIRWAYEAVPAELKDEFMADKEYTFEELVSTLSKLIKLHDNLSQSGTSELHSRG